MCFVGTSSLEVLFVKTFGNTLQFSNESPTVLFLEIYKSFGTHSVESVQIRSFF